MAATYPGTKFTWIDRVDNVDDVLAADINSAVAEIIAIEDDLVGAGDAGGYLRGCSVEENDDQLDTADFPNTTTLYGWNMDATAQDAVSATYGAGGGGTKFGSKDLTVTGSTMNSGNDVLGDAKYCEFDGTGCLISNDAVFNFTGDFSVSFWMYRADWSSVASNQQMVARWSTNGWYIGLMDTEDIRFSTYSGGAETSQLDVDTTGFSDGWHHIVVTREESTEQKIYVDGEIAAHAEDTSDAITAAGGLSIGALTTAGSNPLDSGTRLDEVAIHNGTIWTANEVREIFARSSKKFVVSDQNSVPQVAHNHCSCHDELTANNVDGSDIAEYSACSFIVPMSGEWFITGQTNFEVAVANMMGSIYIKTGSSTYGSAVSRSYNAIQTAETTMQKPVATSWRGFLEAGDTVHLGLALSGGGGNRTISGSSQQTQINGFCLRPTAGT